MRVRTSSTLRGHSPPHGVHDEHHAVALNQNRGLCAGACQVFQSSQVTQSKHVHCIRVMLRGGLLSRRARVTRLPQHVKMIILPLSIARLVDGLHILVNETQQLLGRAHALDLALAVGTKLHHHKL